MRPKPIKLAALCVALLGLAAAALARAETIQHQGLRVNFQAQIAPSALPRGRQVAVRVSLGARIASTDGTTPQLRELAVAINRNGHFDTGALPVCSLEEIQPASTSQALSACRSSVVGEGSFAAKVLLPQQSPFPSRGTVIAFNGRYHGRPAILAHVYGTRPLPTSYTLPFVLGHSHGNYGTLLSASLGKATSKWGYVTALKVTLGGGRAARRGYLTGSCPAPKGFSRVPFPLAKGTYRFAGGKVLSETINRTCRVRGG